MNNSPDTSLDLTKNSQLMHNWLTIGVVASLIIVLAIPVYYFKRTSMEANFLDRLMNPPEFVGRDSCIACHKTEYDKWRNSHHDKAMDMATDDTVLGDFNNTLFEHNGVTTRFFKRGEKFYVNTRGNDGKNKDFQITHTFGAYPLQQYLVPFPGGRLQCLTIAWDDIQKQWYTLPNHTDNSQDWLHWTNSAQNWNGMCAECHSTNLKKGYDYSTDTFNTTWSEIDVSCEACHGPGSHHVKWAEKPAMAREKTDNYHLVTKTRDISPEDQLAICARCHSRRASFADFTHEADDMMDYMVPSLLTETLYYPDGQILDEVYVYGSFTQSKMYQRDIKCSDCHDVHSLNRKADDNSLCLQCHRKDIYDTKDHHFHKSEYKGKPSKGDDCISCHMPQKPYMGIDYRADHSIRIPRPDLSLKYDTPNSCNTKGCHSDKTVEWSYKWASKWYGQRKRAHYVETFALAQAGKPEAQGKLIQLVKDQLQPPVVRSTALSLLREFPGEATNKTVKEALSDPEALIRYTAVYNLDQRGDEEWLAKIIPLLYDPVMAVRLQAALSLASVPDDRFTKNQIEMLESGIAEYKTAMEYSADFPSGRFNLGILYDALGKTDRAIMNYQKAIEVDSQFYPAINNLAMLYNRSGNNEEALKLFVDLVEKQPGQYDFTYSLGLLLVEEKRYAEALIYLKKAAGGLPERPRIHYNLGLLQQMLNNNIDAEKSLVKALELEPDNYDYLLGVSDFLIRQKRYNEAKKLALIMMEKFPEKNTGIKIIEYINSIEN